MTFSALRRSLLLLAVASAACRPPAGLRFEPALSDGCPVAQLVQLPFDFLVRSR